MLLHKSTQLPKQSLTGIPSFPRRRESMSKNPSIYEPTICPLCLPKYNVGMCLNLWF